MENSEEICRICLNSDALISLLGYDTCKENIKTKLHYKFFSCTSVYTSSDDLLPKKICDICASELDKAQQLRDLAQKSDNILRKKYGLHTIDYKNAECHFEPWMKDSQNQFIEDECCNETDILSIEEPDYKAEDLIAIKDEPGIEIPFTKTYKKKKKHIKNLLETCLDSEIKKERLKLPRRAKIKKLKTEKIITNLNLSVDKSKVKIENDNENEWVDANDNENEGDELNEAIDDCVEFKEEPSNCDDEVMLIEYGAEKLLMKKLDKRLGNLNARKRQTYDCTLCNEVYRHRSLFQKHMRVKHQITKFARAKEFMCDVCGNTFYDPYGLRMHKRSHTGDRPFTCNVCGQGFTQQSNMERHISARHRKDKPFQCEQCSKRFGYASTLREHMRAHKGEQQHLCNICLRLFSRRYALMRHRLTHTQARPYACKYCERTYTQSNDLKAHVKRLHTDATTEKLNDYCVKQLTE